MAENLGFCYDTQTVSMEGTFDMRPNGCVRTSSVEHNTIEILEEPPQSTFTRLSDLSRTEKLRTTWNNSTTTQQRIDAIVTFLKFKIPGPKNPFDFQGFWNDFKTILPGLGDLHFL